MYLSFFSMYKNLSFSSFLNTFQTVFFSFPYLTFALFFLSSCMDSYPSIQPSKFVERLKSQESVSFGHYEDYFKLASSQSLFLATLGTKDGGETATERKERRKWTPTDDIVIINSWLKSSKNPVFGNEQRPGALLSGKE